MRVPDFKELVKIADSKVDRSKLEEALSLVSGIGIEASERNADNKPS